MSKDARLAGLVLAAVVLAAGSGRPAPAAERARPIAVAALPDANAPSADLLARLPWRLPGGAAPAGHLATSETPAGELLFGALRAEGRDAEAPGPRLTYLGSESRVTAVGQDLVLANHIGVLDAGAGGSAAGPANPLARLGYRLRLGSAPGAERSYGLLFQYHGADYVTEGSGVAADSLALRLHAGAPLGDGLRLSLHGGHRQSALSASAPRHLWHGGAELTQNLARLGIEGARLHLGLGAQDARDADAGAPARRLNGRLDLSFVPSAVPGSRLALHAEAAREEAAGSVARRAAVRLNLAYRGSLLDRPGSAAVTLGGRTEGTGEGHSRAQHLSLRLGLGSARGRLELAAGLARIEPAQSAGELRPDLSARLTSRPVGAFALAMEARVAGPAGASVTQAGLQARLEF